MATISKLRSAHSSLSTTTVDTINLLQFWDRVEVSNQGATALSVTMNGDTPTALGDNTEIIEAGISKIFPAQVMGGAVVNSASLPCHQIKIIGSGNPYSVVGVAGK